MMKPPPTPMIAASTPTSMPTMNGGIALMYRFEARNRILKGSPCDQWCPRRRGARPFADLRKARMLSMNIRAPTMPRKTT